MAGVVSFLEVKTGAAASTHDVGDFLDQRAPITMLKEPWHSSRGGKSWCRSVGFTRWYLTTGKRLVRATLRA